MNPFLYILLPVHNRIEITRNFIKCLEKQTYRNFKLIVVDDGSTDGTQQMIKERFPESIFITGTGNWWWGGSLQQGYNWIWKNKIPGSDLVLIMNDDSHVEEDYLAIAIKILDGKEKTLLLSEAFSMQTGLLVDKGVVFDFKNFKIRMAENVDEINCMSTRGLFMHAADLYNLKGFRNILLPHYYSDYEFTIRARRKGYKLMIDEKLKLWMNEITTGAGKIKAESSLAYLKEYFSKKHTDHPVYTLNFILLAFPFPYNLKFAFSHIRFTLTSLVKLMIGKKMFN